MNIRLTTLPYAAAGLFCLAVGLLLWNNLALHLARIEEVLPGLAAEDLLRGKTPLLILVGLALAAAAVILARLPWGAMLAGSPRGRVVLAAAALPLTLLPLHWLRSGPVAGLFIALIWAAFLLCAAGLAAVLPTVSGYLAARLPSARAPVSRALWPRLHPWLPAAVTLAWAAYLSGAVFGRLPHVEDSIAQLAQARIFASGSALAAPFEPREFFFFGFMVDTEGWFSQYPPGHPLLLALGVLAGAPWLVNPLLGAIAVVLLYYLLKGLLGESAARWGAWALALSPWALFMSAEFMNHATALTASLAGWLALHQAQRRGGWMIPAGAAFGYCAATRPLEGAIFAVLGGVLLLAHHGWTRPAGWIRTIPYGLGFAATVSLYFLHNAWTTGHPLATGYTLTWGGNGFGFGPVNWGPAHTPGEGIVNTAMSLAGLNVFAWETPLPALAGVAVWAALGGRLTRWDRLFLAALILVPLGYALYYFHDFCFGPRYYYVIFPQVIYFTLRGVQALKARLEDRLKVPPGRLRAGLIGAGAFLLAMQLGVALPHRAAVYADAYWGTDDAPRKEARRLGLHRALVFIENHPWEVLQTRLHALGFITGDAHRSLFQVTGEGLDEVLREMGIEGEEQWEAHPDTAELARRIAAWQEAWIRSGGEPLNPWLEAGRQTYFSNGAVHLDPRDRDPDVILARDLGDHNHALMARHPGRKAYRYAWDEREGRFRILPLEAPALAERSSRNRDP